MRLLLALLLLLPGAALAGSVRVNGTLLDGSCAASHTAIDGVCPSAAAAVADPPLFQVAASTAAGCYASPLAVTGGSITLTRTTVKSCLVGGVWTSCASGQICVEDGGRLNLEPIRQNPIIQTADISAAPWLAGNAPVTPTVTANVGVGLFGGTTATRLDLLATSASQESVAYQSTVYGGTTRSPQSLWAKGVSTSGTICLVSWFNNDSAIATCSFNPSTWTHCATPALLWQATPTYLIAGNDSAFCGGTFPAQSVYLDGGQMDIFFGGGGTVAYPTGPIVNAGSVSTRNADQVSFTNPLVNADGSWSAGGTFTPEFSRTWSISDAYLWSLGTNVAANSARMYALADGKIYFDVYDAGAALKRVTYTHGFAAGSSHKVIGSNAAGTLTVWVDGVSVTVAASGAGTGVISTMPATVFIGEDSAGATQLGGAVSGFGLNNLADGVGL